MKRKLEIYKQLVPENFTHEFGITIHTKKSEQYGMEYDLLCVLCDAIHSHPAFKDIVIMDYRD